ncbi:Ribosome-recycling factor [Candidatus Hepatincolaceae symbiont of Richtersius coronifer]
MYSGEPIALINKEGLSDFTKAIDFLQLELSHVRIDRASPNILDSIKIKAYNDYLSLKEVAGINVKNRTISVTVWEKSNILLVEKAIRESNLGLSPVVKGNIIEINLPSLTEEKRKEAVKVCIKSGEKAKETIRKVRRNFMGKLKDLQKNKKISEDEEKLEEKKFDIEFKKFETKINEMISKKSKEIMEISGK